MGGCSRWGREEGLAGEMGAEVEPDRVLREELDADLRPEKKVRMETVARGNRRVRSKWVGTSWATKLPWLAPTERQRGV